ncbi:hypothetical protein GUITHDRAFT_136553 [Guillardia theta CCMP2712]|uniref:MATH domain-containing protein n=1 Tax=Guillardia theta (strain CCMP2712) TaxID=905079 RepID=L1JKT0_GUITC|nr:hypothetical protein GUITHDRAFT_136553 [Guillardia theta CCMP2712]EKX48927.1 hypothetical protein GUITHDRAFT_136553 [Guillardia theta CCMP2712]|eukprot:XP_005835907.1 hypothetical protein GUITHDRAFT_136553 [Guillardia theta CCMP2712]
MSSCVTTEFKTGKKEYQQSWRMSFYPQGFSDPESTSFFVTNLGCLEGTESNTVSATVEISILRQAEDKRSSSKQKNASRAASAQKAASRLADDRSSSSGSSVMSRSSQMSVSNKARSVGNKPEGWGMEVQMGLSRRFCKSFDQVNHTYGFEKFVDREYLFNLRNGFLLETAKDQIKPMDGTIVVRVTLFCIIGITLNAPEKISEINHNGWQRVEWTISDFSRVCRCFQKDTKLSSPEFSSNGLWTIDLYPHGYRIGDTNDQWISIYLHAVRDYLDRVVKRKCRFRIGLKKQNPMPQALYAILGETEDDDVYFPKSTMITNIFTSSSMTAGYQHFIPFNTLIKGRDLHSVLPAGKSKALAPQLLKGLERELVAGKFDKGGSITIVVDILMIDSVEGQVQQMLQYMRPKKKSKRQQAKMLQWQDVEIFKQFAQQTPCYFCGEQFAPSDLISSPSSRMPQFGYEIGREHVVDTILAEEDPSLAVSLGRMDMKASMQKIMTHFDLLQKVPGMPCMRRRNIPKDPFLDIEPEEVTVSSLSSRFHLLELIMMVIDEHLRAAAKEMQRSIEFERKLEELRKDVEDSLYSKPVCFKCIELCNELESCPTIAAGNLFEEPEDEVSNSKSNTKDDQPLWRQMKDKVDLLVAGVGLDPRNNKLALARGGIYGEPLELARYCSGRLANAEEDALTEVFCDVRCVVMVFVPEHNRVILPVLDLIEIASKEHRKYRCVATGKQLRGDEVFCESCIRFRSPLPEFSERPECAQVFPVCFEAWRQRATELNGKILGVTEQKREEGGAWSLFASSGRRVGVVVQGAQGDDEDDDESPLLDAVRSIPFVGKDWAEGASKWMSEQ